MLYKHIPYLRMLYLYGKSGKLKASNQPKRLKGGRGRELFLPCIQYFEGVLLEYLLVAALYTKGTLLE